MSENVLKTVQQLVQDVIAPDVRESKVRIEALDKRVDLRFEQVDKRFEQVDKRFEQVDKRFEQVDKRFDLMDQKMDVQFRAIMAAIAESRAQVELNNMRLIAALSERVAVLEAQRH